LAYTDAETDSELTAEQKWAAFNIHTIATGYNGGRTYCFRADQAASTAASVERCNDWLAQLKLASKIANQRVARQTLIEASKVPHPPLSLLGPRFSQAPLPAAGERRIIRYHTPCRIQQP
jgi:hypothetical protein